MVYNIGQEFVRPYTEFGKCSLKRKDYKFKSGLYFIIDNFGLLLYVGMTQYSLYDVLYRHFQKWGDSQHRVTYLKDDVKVSVMLTDNPVEKEKIYIKLLNPRDNLITYYNSYEFDLNCWYIREYLKYLIEPVPF